MRDRLSGLTLLGLVLLPLWAASRGHHGPYGVTLELGPGDSPYIAGFAKEFEIEGRKPTQWTGEEGRIDLPLEATGESVLAYDLARVLPQTAHVQVLHGGSVVDTFSCRGGVFLDRRVNLSPATHPLSVTIHVESRDDRKLGVKLHSVHFQGGRGSWLRPRGGWARSEGALLVLVFLWLLLIAGWSVSSTTALVAPVSLLVSLGVVEDPFLTHRLLRLLPGTLLALGMPLTYWARRKGIQDLKIAVLLAVFAFLVRGAMVNHPRFYYPDFMIHARLVQTVRAAGFDFLRAPSAYLWAPARAVQPGELVRTTSGLWMRELNGVPLGMPYSLAFHMPFALLPLGYDQILTAITLTGALMPALALLGTFAFSKRANLPLFGAGLMVFVPSYASKLAVGALPALFGHAVDMAFLAWLAGRREDLSRLRVLLLGIGLVAACDLAYVSALIHMGVLLCLLSSVLFAERFSPRVSLAPLLLGAGGALLSVVLYYRDFLPAVATLLSGLLKPHPAAAYSPEAFLPLLLSRTIAFFGWGYPVLSVVGLALLVRKRRAGLLLPWALSYILLLLFRAEVPMVFRWVHDTLFVTPLLCLASGVVVSWLWEGGRLRRGLAVALLLALGVQGTILSWLSISAEYGALL